jgi:insertion element IS1 protein InsB
LELDEVWSFVYRRSNKRWLWTALCRRTKQIVAAVVGDPSTKTCQKLWALIPESYRRCHTYSDFWAAYAKIFDEETHRSVGKETGETAHMERWSDGTIPYASATLGMSAKRYPFQNLTFGIRL